MELPVLHSTTPLAFEIVANDQNGMRVELPTIGEAARFISIEFIRERAEAGSTLRRRSSQRVRIRPLLSTQPKPCITCLRLKEC